jgi:tetratricopeptide (TPR) repeat protein
MNYTNFVDYLEQPTRLLQLNYQELKNLVIAFPYSPNLRVMLWLRSIVESDGKSETHLQRAAGSTFDRAQLLALSRQFAQAKLQLADWAEPPVLQERAERKAAPALPVSAVAGGNEPRHQPTVSTAEEKQSLAQMLDELSQALAQLPAQAAEKTTETADSHDTVQRTENKTTASSTDTGTMVDAQRIHKMIEDRKTASLARLSARRISSTAAERQQSPAHTKEQPLPEAVEHADHIARQSIRDNDEIASEGLASLLVNQGQYQKAIKMYKKLCLVFPEKKDNFVAIIENLQQKI